MDDLVETAAPIGLFGKHPSIGDFFHRGVSPELRSAFDTWLTGMLSTARDQLDVDWQHTFDTSLPIRFWIGSGLFPPCGVAGVLVRSGDKSGRRFPLGALSPGQPALPPSLWHNQDWYRALEDLLLDLVETTEISPDDMIESVRRGSEIALDTPSDTPLASPPTSGQFWARNAELDASNLWQEAAREDLRRASRSRSYLWVESGDRSASALLGCDGLPGTDAFIWAMSTGFD